MYEDVKKVLDTIDTFLSTSDRFTASQLWNVLSALRGPDMPDSNGELKARSTNHIRAAALPKTCARWQDSVDRTWMGPRDNKQFYGDYAPVCASFYRDGDAVQFNGSHFGMHVESAAAVLGLSTKYAP